MVSQLASCRQEIVHLTYEKDDAVSNFELLRTQMSVLKSSYRELESSLLREREFNSESKRVNADYLVNILSKFLKTNNISERAHLVPVLCDILKLPKEQSQPIIETWVGLARQNENGLVKQVVKWWVSPADTTSSSSFCLGSDSRAS